FFIARGIQLLAEGERRNRGGVGFAGNPYLRSQMGVYYQLKIGQSDQNRTLKCLYQMSCIPPAERDPDTNFENMGTMVYPYKEGRRLVNYKRFEHFCQTHPRLVRRLREQLGYASPLKVIEFLRDNRDIPTRYNLQTGRLKKNALDRFPLMPPKFDSAEP